MKLIPVKFKVDADPTNAVLSTVNNFFPEEDMTALHLVSSGVPSVVKTIIGPLRDLAYYEGIERIGDWA